MLALPLFYETQKELVKKLPGVFCQLETAPPSGSVWGNVLTWSLSEDTILRGYAAVHGVTKSQTQLSD